MSIAVTIHNLDLADLFVTINDLNLAGSPAIVDCQRLNEDETIQISVQENRMGTGNIQWSAVRVDDPKATPAQRTVEVSPDTTVDVTTHFG